MKHTGCALAVFIAVAGVNAAGPGPEFTKPPTAVFKAGTPAGQGGAAISFAVSQGADVDIAVLDSKGIVVRHLAAALLGGKTVPQPFRPGLEQEIVWDGKDDAGRDILAGAGAGAFRVRVRLGVKPVLDRFIPSGILPRGPPTAIGVAPDGTVCVLSSRDQAGGSSLFLLNRDGKYLRTILPSPAGLKKEQVRGMERLTLADGSEVPIVYSAFIADLAPYLPGMRSQQIVVSRNGWIVFASGGSNWTDQIVPRHALVLRADGSAPPEIGFIGPRLGNHARFASGLRPQQIALSPDGQTLYFAGMGTEGKTPKGIHCIGKTTWDAGTDPEPFIGKPDEAGSDGEHLNAPTSVATDGTGNILVVDSGNNRIAVFDASGKYLGETAVPNPGHVCVHPTDGTMYVGSSDSPLTGKHEPAKPYSILKFDKPAGGREVARYEFGNYRYHPVIALDSSAKEPRIWLSHSPAWGQSLLVPLSDRGDKLVAGKNALDADSNVFAGPMFIAADPVNERLYVGDFSQTILKVDLKDDKVSRFTKASEAAVDREGNVYVLAGYGSNAILRYDSSGKPAPFPGSDSNKITIPYRAGLPHVGVRGLTVAPNGDIYAFEEVLKPQQLHVFGPDGQPKKSSVIKDIPKDSANSVAVDRDGNIYVGVNVHDPKALYPDELAGQIPAFGWERTYGRSSGWYSFPQRDVPPLPWSALYLNNYLYHYGNVFKFGPEGGCFWTGGKPNKGDNPRPEGVSADAVEFRTALLGNVVWASGAKWVYKGFALAASRTENSGDPTCSCMTSRFGMDEYGRLWVPDVFRFRVTALDASGNEMTRFGGYGNVDSMGSLSAGEGPAIPLCFPNAVAAAGDRLYVADRKSRRIVVVKLTSAAEETCAIK